MVLGGGGWENWMTARYEGERFQMITVESERGAECVAHCAPLDPLVIGLSSLIFTGTLGTAEWTGVVENASSEVLQEFRYVICINVSITVQVTQAGIFSDAGIDELVSSEVLEKHDYVISVNVLIAIKI